MAESVDYKFGNSFCGQLGPS